MTWQKAEEAAGLARKSWSVNIGPLSNARLTETFQMKACKKDYLLPATGVYTQRQKFQRAFAREFLCLFMVLREFPGGGRPDDEAIEQAASHFQVSPLLIRSTLVNKGILEKAGELRTQIYIGMDIAYIDPDLSPFPFPLSPFPPVTSVQTEEAAVGIDEKFLKSGNLPKKS